MVLGILFEKSTILPRLWRKIYAKRGGGGHSDLMSALRGGFQNLMHAYQGGGGVKKPQKYAYIICERPLSELVDKIL